MRCALLLGALVLAAPRPARAQSFAAADAAVAAGVRAGVYPGAVLVVGTRDSVLHARGFGRLTWSPRSAQASPDSTVWDLASLTKVVATTPALMLLVDRGTVDLDAPVARYLPRFTGA
ncbi:MAG TPA: serine hydrolase domain-containing protein, partial [Gemmatimonadales bacterium]|nr:serine hydrolase domain-containing protein [Gemmatimonadales bacterium]